MKLEGTRYPPQDSYVKAKAVTGVLQSDAAAQTQQLGTLFTDVRVSHAASSVQEREGRQKASASPTQALLPNAPLELQMHGEICL